MKQLAPIVLFAYNRPNHLKKTIESLLKNKLAKESEIYFFSDGSKNDFDKENVELVRKYMNQLVGFKKITISASIKNKGLANSVIEGITQIFNQYDKAIILEDDLQFSEYFLDYMNNALDFYENNSNVFSISGYCLPIEIPTDYKNEVFLFNRINSWGWATWKNRWSSIDWKVSDFSHFINDKNLVKKFNQCGEDVTIMLLKQMLGKIDSWAIRFNYACFKQNKLNVYPIKSLVQNIGTDGSGSHVKATKRFVSEIANKEPKLVDLQEVDLVIANNYKQYFKSSFYRRIINFLKLNLMKYQLKK